MKLSIYALCVGAIMVSSASVANAATFDFHYNFGDISVTGALMAVETQTPGVFQATGISGHRGDAVITGLSFDNRANNLISTTEPFVDGFGLGYSYAGGSVGTGTAILYDYRGYQEFDNNDIFVQDVTNVSFTRVSDVPLPQSAPLLGAALAILAIGGAWRKRTKLAATA